MDSTRVLGRFKMSNNEIVPGFDVEGKDESIKIQLQRIDEKCLVFYLNGYMDTYNTSSARARFEKAIEAGFIHLIFDCRQLNWISSTAIGLFVQTMKNLRLQGGNLVLLNIQPKVFELFQLLGFSQFFRVSDTLSDAIDAFDSKPKTSFPLVFKCPICNRKLKASKTGSFLCSECKTILVVNSEMHVLLG